jgi:hypothetical protein
MVIDLNFIKFYVESFHKKTLESYYNIDKSAISNWKKRRFPKKRLNEFILREGSDNIYFLFEKIYPKSE